MQAYALWLWFVTKCNKLKSGFRYRPEFVFGTFPWPQFEMGSAPAPGAADHALAVSPGARTSTTTTAKSPPSSAAPKGCREGAATDTRGACSPQTIAKINAVAAARELRRVRTEALPKLKGGLRALYRTLELPGANPLKDAHAALDTAVLTAYGFSAKKDLLAQLLALNQQVAAKLENGEPVTPPGVPKNYPDVSKLVTEDCIQPQSTGYPPYEPPNPTPLRQPIPEQAVADAAHFYSAKEEGPPYRTS